MIYDFHTHSSLSDGELSPAEMLRRAAVAGYTAVALTDHASCGDMQRIVPEVVKACELARKYWKITAIPGIELTHCPARSIAELAKTAKEMGAWIVVVHGETIVEPVEKGTNLAAIKCPQVDILAHPGFLTEEEAALAAQNGIYIEVSARKGHSLANGYVVKTALKAGADMLLNSDAHSDSDLLSVKFAEAVLRGAGLEKDFLPDVLRHNPENLVNKLLNLNKAK
ncbi:MAG TPA: histidinol phosphate phosphatase domain-containing protein [Dehalococcoidales bacterium]|nr:histidinol phosphate phosphatase domain-containing protein [Dehalococcoidales bacterium]